ncbi:MAG: hypothetical protein U0694_05925 [Anaerolineae bacterium]
MMEAVFSWYDAEQTILLIVVTGQAGSWDEVLRIVETQQQWYNAIDHKAHSIFDVRSANSRVPRGNALLNMKRLMDLSHRNEDLTILLGKHVILRPLIEIVDRAYRLDSTDQPLQICGYTGTGAGNH